MAEAFITRRGGGGMKFATGTIEQSFGTATGWYNLKVTGLDFTPKFVTYRMISAGSDTSTAGTVGYRELVDGKHKGSAAYSSPGYGSGVGMSNINIDVTENSFTATVYRVGSNTNMNITWWAFDY